MTSAYTDLDSPMVDTMIPSNIAQDVLPLTRMRTMIARGLAIFLSLAVVNITVPAGAMSHLAPDPKAPKPASVVKAPKKKATTRPMTAKEMRTVQGKAGKNPYFAGQNKWDVIYKGINLMSGNYTASGTDLTFEGGYGIPINVTRSYSSNNMDEGPLGEGWTLSVDVRNTAGGLLKSSGSPVRSVPVSFKERPALQGDPRIPDANEPVEAVIATDAGGMEETIQKDADGILTTPAWDKNRNVSEYEDVVVGGSLYQILKKNIVTTPEGTVYVYEKKGNYPSGTTPWNDLTATPTPCNVLKPVSATDRHGNATTYTYGTTDVTFTKSNGTVTEKRLESIQMPNGHVIQFTWGNGTNAPTNRIRIATDGVRNVTYGYTGGLLTSVTTPAGKVTSYGYGSSVTASNPVEPGSASNLLTSVTDPRGLTTTIGYFVDLAEVAPYGIYQQGVKAYKIVHPNGLQTHVGYQGNTRPSDSWYVNFGTGGVLSKASYVDVYGSGIGDRINMGTIDYAAASGVPEFKVSMSGNEQVHGFIDSDASNWVKTFDINSQNLLVETQITGPGQAWGDLGTDRRLTTSTFFGKAVRSTNTYNFIGNPLSKTIQERNSNSATTPIDSWPVVRTATVSYAYWGKEKYYQQKAVKDQAGRVSFTEYYDWNATQGKKGQTYRTYDEARTSFSNKTATNWKYVIVPDDTSKYSAQFDYDAKGRPIDVWKIQKTTTNPWLYVQTRTEYGADATPIWGGVTSIVEDYGSGKINRTTTTLAYDSIGRATHIRDAAGREFLTNYDLDGVIQSVYRVDGTFNDPVVSYAYGTSGLENGVVTSVTDGLSGVIQSFSYASSGAGKGQISGVTETNGSNSYTTSYSYNVTGERETAIYATPNGTTRWKYADYVQVGAAHSPSRVFQTLIKLDGSGNPTSEQFHYHFDSAGRLLESSFAQTPQSGQTGYPSSHPAGTRARAYYVYDVVGRMTSVEHYWDVWGGSSYTSTPILGNASSYELAGLNRGLKTANTFYIKDPSSNNWLLERTENYGYDANLDYLTSADYNDGLANENPNWSYDAAGNRNDASVVDNLNRATTIGGVSRTYDILGNTLTKGSSMSYSWDVLGRMTLFAKPSAFQAHYTYRADGMRVKKRIVEPGEDTSTYHYYDGQMPVETNTGAGSGVIVTRNGLGARGIDRMEEVSSSGTVVKYPLYDGHGNMVATLAKAGSSYSTGDTRSYDAWGVIRRGGITGAAKERYGANLGHIDDEESSLTYMRARYYEPTTGRFISEDRAMDGVNWYVYCENKPISGVDSSGNNWFACQAALFAVFVRAMQEPNPQAAIIYMITHGKREINHHYIGEMTAAFALEEQLALNEFIGWLNGGIPLLQQEMTDAMASRAAQHRMEAQLIKIFGAFEIGLYCLIIELSDPLLGMG